mmetsp:Transcript_31985/g.77304  ORF Transcript_31985/g.77304 Transcript_31985/m.77304 type:complete len:188 (+) Transcript_31985:284-847(+)
MTIVGFLTYHYDEVAGGGSRVEMNRCSFGNTGEGYGSLPVVSMDGGTDGKDGNADTSGHNGNDDNNNNLILITNIGKVECNGRSVTMGNDQCADCSASKIEDVTVADLSYCRAPWQCDREEDVPDKLSLSELCRKFQQRWFAGRLQMEDVHPQLRRGDGTLCADGRYRPMELSKPSVGYRPRFMERR